MSDISGDARDAMICLRVFSEHFGKVELNLLLEGREPHVVVRLIEALHMEG